MCSNGIPFAIVMQTDVYSCRVSIASIEQTSLARESNVCRVIDKDSLHFARHMKIGKIDFPKHLLDALRDNKLVVFAGAGVSMGEPSRLFDFKSLTKKIAWGTGQSRGSEAPDRFLGRLQHSGVEVHVRARNLLSRDGMNATSTHRDLLRLFPKAGPIHLVTTNFDLLFEQSVEKGIFDGPPGVFQAPALPSGRRFDGIVHVHGSVSDYEEMVLTDEDFGRAYMTDGFAQRFLTELFGNYTVLFVGYSHNDLIMNYLARALIGPEADRRYALIGEEELNAPDWNLLGIKPITYPQVNSKDHTELSKGIEGLADLARRSLVKWKENIDSIGRNSPPNDLNKLALIDYALGDEVKARFFTKNCNCPKWIDWLDKCGHLNPLFGKRTLSKPERVLSWWLANHCVDDCPEKLFRLISKHNSRLHPTFWNHIATKIGRKSVIFQDKSCLSRLTSLLLEMLPNSATELDGEYVNISYSLYDLGKSCIRHELWNELMLIFDEMTESRLTVRNDNHRHDNENNEIIWYYVDLPLKGEYGQLEKLWKNGLSRNLRQVAQPLLERLIRRLENRYVIYRAWSQTTRDSEPDLDPLEGEAVLIVTNAVRGCLDWLESNEPEAAKPWRARLQNSDSPLLRSLVAHDDFESDDLRSSIGIGDDDIPRPIMPNDLLAKRPDDLLSQLLSFETRDWLVGMRGQQIEYLSSAITQNIDWGLDLADALAADQEWNAYPWEALIDTWSKPGLDNDTYKRAFEWFAETKLYSKHGKSIAKALLNFIKDNSPALSLPLLPQTNRIAIALWQNLDRGETHPEDTNWLTTAMAHPAGHLADYWVYALCVRRKNLDSVRHVLDDEHRQPLLEIINDSSQLGCLGTSIFTRSIDFLMKVDRKWAQHHLLPLFEIESKRFQAAWHGALPSLALNLPVAKMMTDLFLNAIPLIRSDVSIPPQFFAKSYACMLLNHAKDRLNKWIPRLYKNPGQNPFYTDSQLLDSHQHHLSIRGFVASAIDSALVRMSDRDKGRLWKHWLKDYWQNRVEGVPAKLTPNEVRPMLDWLRHLDIVFSEAVNLAVEMPQTSLLGSTVPSNLRHNKEWHKHPEAEAKLFIYLWDCDPEYMCDTKPKLLDSLIKAKIPLKFKEKLKDIKVQLD